MESPRSPPLFGSSSPPGTPPTPRSKLKQLFATLDSDSDNDVSISATKVTEASVRPTLSTDAHAAADESSEEDDDIFVPRGRLAARMKAGADASGRLGNMLAASASPEASRLTLPGAQAEAAGDEDAAAVSRPRKLKNRVRRRESPAVEPRRLDSSPGLFVTPRKDLPSSQRDVEGPSSKSPDALSPRLDSSPGMFVTPRKDVSLPRHDSGGSGSDSDVPQKPLAGERFKALVAKKRAERLAREAEEDRQQTATQSAHDSLRDDFIDDDEDSNISDDEGGRKLTQEGRPLRKASKKALEEMHRETQRMSRNLQLAHEAKVKKKITKASLFERFNFRPQGAAADEKHSSSSRPTTPSPARQTDTEMREAETPPSSPPILRDASTPSKLSSSRPTPAADDILSGDQDVAFGSPDAIAAQVPKSLDKGKGKATAADFAALEQEKPVVKSRTRVRLPVHTNLVTIDSDDELVITDLKKAKIDAIFDRLPAEKAKESRSMLALRHLAQVTSPGKDAKGRGREKHSMTAGQLQAVLQNRARQQAKMERDRRLDLLKAKGVHIQTDAEREQEMADVEDIVAKARKEAEEIMQREREAAKLDKKESDEFDPLALDDSDDEEEYVQREEPSEVELSGSEESGDEGEDDGENEGENASQHGSEAGALLDDEAESAGESEEEKSETYGEQDAGESEDDIMRLPVNKARRGKKQVTIISDDEDEDEDVVDDDEVDIVAKTPRPKTAFPKSPSLQQNSDSPQVPTSVLRSATKTFIPGLPIALGDPAGLGLTQIFAGTMGDSQPDVPFGSASEPMPTFDAFPDSNFSQRSLAPAEEMILDSQPTQRAEGPAQDDESQGVQLHYSQTQMHGLDSLLREQTSTQMSELLMAPTQDEGYHAYTPLKERFVVPSPSTVSTAVIPSTQRDLPQNESPLVKKGRLRRKMAAPAADSDDEQDGARALPAEAPASTERGPTAFSVMQDAAMQEQKTKVIDAFNKKKSKAREMVEEQADESEDEYAGLGGADGEDSDDDSAASVHEMIDDDHKTNAVDDAKLAAFYA